MFNLEFNDYTVNKYPYIGEFHEGLAKVRNNKGLYGYINKRGKEVIPCQFKEAKNFSEGLAPVCNEEGKWGYIDKKGNLVISYKFDDATCFSEGIGIVNIKGKDFYINKQGEKITNKEFEDAYSFRNGFGIVKYFEEGKSVYSYIDEAGKLFGKYLWCSRFDSNGLAIVCQYEPSVNQIINKDFKVIKEKESAANFWAIMDGMILSRGKNMYCFYDCEFNKIIPSLFNNARTFKDGAAIVEIGENIGFVKKDGFMKMFSKKTQYTEIRDFCEGLAAVKNIDGLWGFINKKGEEVIPCQFIVVDDFSEGLAGVVDKDNNLYYIDKKGNKNLEMPVIYCSCLEMDGVELDNENKNGATVCIKADTEDELNNKKMQVLSIAREMILANMAKQIDEMAYSIPNPHTRNLSKNG